MTYDIPTLPVEEDTAPSKLAIAYCRVSSDRQKKKYGVAGQVAACMEQAEKEGLEIIQTFKDEAISGKTTVRPGLTECLRFIDRYNRRRGQHIAYLLCSEISRISRPEFIDEGLEIIKHFWQRGLVVYDVFGRQYYERSDDLNMIRLLFDLIKAKEERVKCAQRSSNAIRQRVRLGYWTFAAPTGYKYVK